MRVRREDLVRSLEGHRLAAARLRAAALRRLPSLGVDEARAAYDSLCRVWEASRDLGDRQAVDRRAIADRISLRRRLSAPWSSARGPSWAPGAPNPMPGREAAEWTSS